MIGVAMMRKLMFMLLLAAVLLGSMMTTGVAQSMPEYDGPPWEFEVELKDIIRKMWLTILKISSLRNL